MSNSCEIALRWMLQNLQWCSKLVQVMAWCHHSKPLPEPLFNGLMQERRNSIANAMELRLSGINPVCWSRSMLSNSETRPQWINQSLDEMKLKFPSNLKYEGKMRVEMGLWPVHFWPAILPFIHPPHQSWHLVYYTRRYLANTSRRNRCHFYLSPDALQRLPSGKLWNLRPFSDVDPPQSPFCGLWLRRYESSVPNRGNGWCPTWNNCANIQQPSHSHKHSLNLFIWLHL